jgi:large subunit ribosomal protein L19
LDRRYNEGEFIVSKHQSFESLEKEYQQKKVPKFSVGDTVKVRTRIVEGQKERIQTFLGVVVGKNGGGLSETFSVYRNAYGCSMEKVFLLHSPLVDVVVESWGKVKKAKLTYIKGETGRKAKVTERIVSKARKNSEPMVQQEIPSEEANPQETPSQEESKN